MRGRVLIDTNMLVYAYDVSEPEKQRRALDVLRGLAERETGVVSTQIMAEMFVVLTRKLSSPLSAEQAVRSLERHMRTWQVVSVTDFIVLEAARGVRDHAMSFWDAQVWATAKLNQIPVVLGEDFASGSVIEGVQFENPFG
ncbi:MAG TPA: PIN domain nuclease [Firmicutes bacterium]|jgi:predicted nucleic acid-binding protein|nr:PIN domain nuclease [Bacillota bacterium]